MKWHKPHLFKEDEMCVCSPHSQRSMGRSRTDTEASLRRVNGTLSCVTGRDRNENEQRFGQSDL